MRIPMLLTILVTLLSQQVVYAQPAGNLLRNGEFQDDWITLLPQTKNHHWCFSSEFYNRRDYNPDAWYYKGSWDWQNADAWEFSSWQNRVAALVLLVWVLGIAVVRGRTPVELLTPDLDRRIVTRLRRWVGWRAVGAVTDGVS